jgi:formamidopyrimidine-DNA glycosylase
MPELPEVQTVLTSLKPKLLGRRIERAEICLEKIIKHPEARKFAALLQGSAICDLRRHGKYLLLVLDKGHILAVHLRMTGRLIYSGSDAPRGKYTHVVFYLDNGAELRFQDMRQFGTMNLIETESFAAFCSQKDLGPDALDPAFGQDLFAGRFQGRRGQVKKLLLDQSLAAGIGNIYANEILWRSQIHPERSAGSLTPEDLEHLYQSMRSVLQAAVASRGTTLRDYVDGDGNPGGFQSQLAVHGREGEPCPKCGQTIIRVKIGGRSSFVCPCCQPASCTPHSFRPGVSPDAEDAGQGPEAGKEVKSE